MVALPLQGLDGRNNLLHALNSTTYLCFVDTDGLLTETCTSIQEICVLESEEKDGDVLSRARHSDIRAISLQAEPLEIVRSATLPAAGPLAGKTVPTEVSRSSFQKALYRLNNKCV